MPTWRRTPFSHGAGPEGRAGTPLEQTEGRRGSRCIRADSRAHREWEPSSAPMTYDTEHAGVSCRFHLVPPLVVRSDVGHTTLRQSGPRGWQGWFRDLDRRASNHEAVLLEALSRSARAPTATLIAW